MEEKLNRTGAETEASEKAKFKKSLSIFVRFVVAIGLIIFLLHKLDISQIITNFSIIKGWPFLIAILINGFGIFLSAVRWKVFLRAQGADPPLLGLFKVYLISLFLGNILPSGAGIDIMRGIYLAKHTGQRAQSFASVIIDRVLGFIAIMLIAMLSLPFGFEEVRPYRKAVLILAVIIIGGTFLALRETVYRTVVPVLRKLPLGEKLIRLYDAFYCYRDKGQAIAIGLVLSFLVQLSFVGAAYFSGVALSLHLPVFKVILYVTLINLLAAVPVSVGGIGLRESGFVIFFGDMIGREAAFTLSVTYYLSGLINSLVGAVFLMMGRDKI